MNTYIVSGTVTVSCWTLVEADSEEEAVNIASDRPVAEDRSYDEREYFYVEQDGTPQNLRAEKA